jgi:hypothetical protein
VYQNKQQEIKYWTEHTDADLQFFLFPMPFEAMVEQCLAKPETRPGKSDNFGTTEYRKVI